LVIQIDGIHMDEDLMLVAAIGVDAEAARCRASVPPGDAETAL
jgi:hypothetical protein